MSKQSHWLLNPHEGVITMILTASIIAVFFGVAILSFVQPQAPIARNDLGGVQIPAPLPRPQAGLSKSSLLMASYDTASQKQNAYVLNLSSGKYTALLPDEYEFINQSYRQDYPDYLIASRDGQLYSYDVKAGEHKMDLIYLGAKPFQLKTDQEVGVQGSISERNRFLFIVHTVDPSKISEFDGSAAVLSTATYNFDASTHQLTKTPNTRFSSDYSCSVYDSKYQRFFTWPCGEGVGNAIPLQVANMKGEVTKTLVFDSDLGLDSQTLKGQIDTRGRINYKNGIFFAYVEPIDKVIMLDTADPALNLVSYNMAEGFRPDLGGPYTAGVYSMLWDKTAKALIIGGGQAISVIKFDDNLQAISQTKFDEPGVYANFIYSDGDRFYYKFKNQIKVVNLSSLRFEQPITIPSNMQDICLFR